MRIPPTPVHRAIAEIGEPDIKRDHVHRVATARVAFADHALLQRDFPGLAGTGAAADRARERWLLDNAGVQSVGQAGQTAVNTPIETSGDARNVWRPETYGRAVIVPVADPAGTPGLLDVKGAGVGPGYTPSLESHASGLCLLREVFRECLFQRAIDQAFADCEPRFWTLPVYGVIDLGFDAKTRRGESVPAGIMVRRAHRRPLRGFQIPRRGSREERLHFEIELLLRHYGLTSCHRAARIAVGRKDEDLVLTGPFFNLTVSTSHPSRVAHDAYFAAAELPNVYETLNIQLTRLDRIRGVRAQLVDFGHFEMRSRFDYALLSAVLGGALPWGAKILRTDRAFVQPDPALCLAENHWGIDPLLSNGGQIAERSLTARPWLWTDRLAKDFRDGRLDAEAVLGALRTFGDAPCRPRRNGRGKRLNVAVAI